MLAVLMNSSLAILDRKRPAKSPSELQH